MASEIQTPDYHKGASCVPADVRYVTRQPVMDLLSKVYAYELLFSDGPGAILRHDRESAALTMIDNTVLFGLNKLASGRPAFVPCTAEMLSSTLVEVLPAEMTVLEIRPGIDSPETIKDACYELRRAGYRFALDQFTWRPGIELLVDMADYVKVNFSQTTPQQRQALLDRLDGVKIARIADKVETQEQFAQARDEGFTFVQGFYFCRPELLKSRKVPANKISQIEILQLLNDDTLDLRKLTQLVKRDASLTYRLLRLINSPVCAMQQEVYSVQAALLAVGEEAFRRMAAVAITSELGADRPPELLRMAFVRGRFCELAARSCGLDCSEQYLLGLFSLLGVMLRTSMKELAPMLPLREGIRRALMGEQVHERILLEWLEGYERGNWEICDSVVENYRLDREALLCCFEGAVEWAEASLHLI